jgi:hypothetical protein
MKQKEGAKLPLSAKLNMNYCTTNLEVLRLVLFVKLTKYTPALT